MALLVSNQVPKRPLGGILILTAPSLKYGDFLQLFSVALQRATIDAAGAARAAWKAKTCRCSKSCMESKDLLVQQELRKSKKVASLLDHKRNGLRVQLGNYG